MASLLPHNLVRMFFSLVLVYSVFGSWPLTSASSPPIASPATEAELICHTDNPAECYPKVFSATDQFQVVHDDQDLPPGLHVQLDIQTGQKQAKLYNPDEENPALAGLPVSQDVIVVDHEPVHGNEPRIPANAPTYEPVGIIKPPQEKSDEFSLALQTIKKSTGQQAIDANVREALEVLEDFSHHIYYGLQIAEDVEAVQSLFCLLFGGDSTRSSTERADFLAASVLSASVGNNARALAAIEASWDSIAEKQCKSGSHSIKHELFKGLAPRSEPGTELETEEANRIRLYLTVMSGLMKSLKIRTEFLEDNGMQNFLQTLLRNGKVWEPAQVKVALITSDTFLDEDFGATLGVWPTQPQVDAGKCAEDGSPSLGDECWAYHLEKMSSSGDAPEWRKRLLSLIRHTQPPSSPSDTLPRHNEL